ncbi:MAG: carboxypeptidase-like regulatory domain-containing protein [Bacteroidota bacterium]
MRTVFTGILILAMGFLQAQEYIIKGKIISAEDKSAMQYVAIQFNETGTYTNQNGEFEIHLNNAGEIKMIFSFIGYEKMEKTVLISAFEKITDLGIIEMKSSIIQIGEMVVTGNETMYSRQYEGSNVRMTKKELEITQPVGSEEALKKMAGINVSGDMGISNRLNVGIRGSYPRRSANILLMEDGTPIAPAPYLSPDAYYNPPSDRLDGIEVIKGADILTMGSNTAYGAVNYITKKPPVKPALGIHLTEGTNGYHSRYITYGGTWDNVGAELQVLQKSFDGFQNNSQSAIFNTTAKVYADLGKKSSVYLKLNYHQENSKASYSSLTPFTYAHDPRQNPFDADDLATKRYAADIIYNLRLGENAVLVSKIYGSQFVRDWWRQENTLVKASQVKSYVGDEIYNDRYSYMEGLTFGNDDYVRVGKMAGGRESTRARNRLFRVAGIQETLKYSWTTGDLQGKLEVAVKAHTETFSNVELKNDSSRFSRSGNVVLNEYFTLTAYSGYLKNTFKYKNFSASPVVRYEIIQMRQFDLMKIAADPNNDGSKFYGSIKNEFGTFLPGTTLSYQVKENEKNQVQVYAGVYKGYTAPVSSVAFLNVEDNVVGTTNDQNAVNMRPEESFNYETGTRMNLAKELVYAQVTYFNNTLKNYYSAGRNEAFESLGKVNINGVEAALQFHFGQFFKSGKHQLSLGISGSWMNSRILDGRLRDSDLLKEKHTDATKQEVVDKINAERNGFDVYYTSSTGGDSLVTQSTFTLSDFSSFRRIDMVFGENGIANNAVPYVPQILINSSLTYTFKGLTVSGNINYVSIQYTDYLNMNNETAEGAAGKLDAFTTIDASVSYSFEACKKKCMKGLSLFVTGKNLTDEVYKASRLHRVSSGIMPGGFRQINGGLKFVF